LKSEFQEEKLLRIRLLGPPEVSFEGRSLRFGRKKALAPLCYLAAEGRKRSRRELAELLSPRSDPRSARTDLRSVLTTIRQTLAENGASGAFRRDELHLLVVEGDLLELEPRVVELDLRALEAAVSLARRETSKARVGGGSADDSLGNRDKIAYLEDTLGIYRGEFMEGFSLGDAPEFMLWLEAERAKWRGVIGELCERLSHLEGEEGLIGEAIGTARLWARHSPSEEAAQRRLMELLSSAGESERALLANEETRLAVEFLLWAEARGGDILKGAASEGTGLTYGPLIEIIRPRMTDVDEQDNGTVSEQRLYQLIRQPKPIADRHFEIEFLDSDVEAYCFTFG
jgi:DNA-binding SARP family transcriptional activator